MIGVQGVRSWSALFEHAFWPRPVRDPWRGPPGVWHVPVTMPCTMHQHGCTHRGAAGLRPAVPRSLTVLLGLRSGRTSCNPLGSGVLHWQRVHGACLQGCRPPCWVWGRGATGLPPLLSRPGVGWRVSGGAGLPPITRAGWELSVSIAKAMATRSRSPRAPPVFAPRVFGACLPSGAPSHLPPSLPGFVARCPSLTSPASEERPAAPAPAVHGPAVQHAADRAQRYAALGAKHLPGRPCLPRPVPCQPASSLRCSRHKAGSAAATGTEIPEQPRDQMERDSALPGLRRGAPGRLPAKPEPQSLLTTADREQALTDLTDGFYAASSCSAVRARRSCYTRLLALWGETPHPLSLNKILFLAAGLKARRYRSAASVLSQLRVDAEREGQEITTGFSRAFTDSARSCRRGLGPALTARALTFERLGDLPLAPAPWAPGGPVGPAAAIVVGTWWLLRETEAANLRASHVTFKNARGTLTVEILLPVSKADQEAKGIARAHACLCRGPARRPECPAHAALRQMTLIREMFPEKFGENGPQRDAPFFPQSTGKPVSKEGFAKTILAAARHLDMDLTTADGTERFTGHSLRATGAQGLATLGVDTYAIQLLGRWGSSTVLRYVKAASITAAAAAARAAAASVSLSALVDHASAAGLAGERCSETAVADLVEMHVPGALARSRATLVAELRQELLQPSRTRPRSSSSSSTTSSSSSVPPEQAGNEEGGADVDGPTAPPGADGAGPAVPEPAVAAAGPPAPSPVSPGCPVGGSGGVYPEYVSNLKHERRHVIRVGPPCLIPTRWKTICGWRFGKSEWAGAVDPTHKPCERCASGVGSGLQ